MRAGSVFVWFEVREKPGLVLAPKVTDLHGRPVSDLYGRPSTKCDGFVRQIVNLRIVGQPKLGIARDDRSPTGVTETAACPILQINFVFRTAAR